MRPHAAPLTIRQQQDRFAAGRGGSAIALTIPGPIKGGIAMKGRFSLPASILLFGVAATVTWAPSVAVAQTPEAERNATREQLRSFLATAGARKDVNIEFRQSDKNPWNFVGVAKDNLANSDMLEVVVGLSDNRTLAVIVYPHYHGGYINLGKAADGRGLANKLLNLNDHNFFYWGADDSGDVFTCYNFTLESGFPDQSLLVAMTSIRAQDQFIAALKPYIDGPAAK